MSNEELNPHHEVPPPAEVAKLQKDERRVLEAEAQVSAAEADLHAAEAELMEDVADLESYAKSGHQPPRAKLYRFKVNETICEWPEETIKGREVLEKAGLRPPENYTLREKVAGSAPRKVELDEVVHLRKHGLEKFRAIRKGQQEGDGGEGRREVALLDHDRTFLDGYGLPWESIVDGSRWVLLHRFKLPAGASPNEVTVAIRMEDGYPFGQLDMMYVHPAIGRLDGKAIPQTQAVQQLDGKAFQRWSRHRTSQNPWVPGQDSLETHVYFVEDCFNAEFSRA
jgi:hypothetical protein